MFLDMTNYIFIIQKEHQEKYNIKSVLKILQPNCKIIELDHLTEGAACTTLLAKSNSTHLDIVHFAQGDIERHQAVKEVLEIYGDE